MWKLLGARKRGVLARMQKSVILNFEHCQNIYDKYLVRALRTPDFHFFSPEIQKHKCHKTCILLMFLRRFYRVYEFVFILNRFLVEIATL